MDSLPFLWPPLWDGRATGFTWNRMHLVVGYVMFLWDPKLQGHICRSHRSVCIAGMGICVCLYRDSTHVYVSMKETEAQRQGLNK